MCYERSQEKPKLVQAVETALTSAFASLEKESLGAKLKAFYEASQAWRLVMDECSKSQLAFAELLY